MGYGAGARAAGKLNFAPSTEAARGRLHLGWLDPGCMDAAAIVTRALNYPS